MIVLIEDDLSIQKLVKYALEMNGLEIECFTEWDEFLKKRPEKVDLFILDIMLPGLSGLEILSRLREEKATATTPVMFLTAKSTELDKVTGLDGGADDYLTKPFGVLELISRVKALLRRSSIRKSEDEDILRAGNIVMKRGEHRVYLDGNPVTLTLKEYELLEYLMRNEGLAVKRETLLSEVWGYDYYGESRTVDVHIRHLREKLDPEGKIIETVKGLGYRIEK
jgi:two-component system, OmpR family, alkaline phosphatase synthesis response regulator PhoP